jgi:predicted ATPase
MPTDAMFCDHANEVPQTCPCAPDCYCRTHTCKPVRSPLRIAFAGASGTGKSTLAEFVAKEFGLPVNPVGSRSVSKAMGFESPYDVDKAGKRAEFQRRLVTEKRAWEDAHESFVVDRTTLDNLAYTMLHDVHCVDDALLESVVQGVLRYTHVIYCPVAAFCNPGNDTARVQSLAYHQLYDVLIEGLVDRYVPLGVTVICLEGKLDSRHDWLRHSLRTM